MIEFLKKTPKLSKKLKFSVLVLTALILSGCGNYYVYSRAPLNQIYSCAKSPFNGDLREPIRCIFISPFLATYTGITLVIDTALVPFIFISDFGSNDSLDELEELEKQEQAQGQTDKGAKKEE